MAWSPDTAYLAGLDFFTHSVGGLGPADFELPSPCSEWTVLDVLGHVGTGIDFGTRLLRDERPVWTPNYPPGTGVEGDPRTWWDERADGARQSMVGLDLAAPVDTPSGMRTVGEGLSFPAVDLFVHGWDLSRSVGREFTFPTEAIEFGHAFLDPLPPERVRHPGVFAAPVAGTSNLTPTQTFIAWTGRDPLWEPPGAKSPWSAP